MDNNPIIKIDVLGDNWFYYQKEGTDAKDWYWHEGKEAKYTDTKGKEQSIKSDYEYLVKFNITGKNSYGAIEGNIELYNQDKLEFKNKYVFSGGGWWTSDGVFSDNKEVKNYEPIAEGNYTMNMGNRDDGESLKKGSKDGPSPFKGIQNIPDNTINSGGYNVSENYGNGRIYLTPNEGQPDRNLYLHGKKQWYNRRTHGCVCDKDEMVFKYFWSGSGKDYRGKVPFSVRKKK